MTEAFSEQALETLTLLKTCSECDHPVREYVRVGDALPPRGAAYGGSFGPHACYHERFVLELEPACYCREFTP